MAAKKSKLKAMAEAGNPWAIETLKRAQEIGRAAALRGIAMQRQKGKLWKAKRHGKTLLESARLEERMARDSDPPNYADAKDILEWRLGRNVPEWRIFQLAQAITQSETK